MPRRRSASSTFSARASLDPGGLEQHAALGGEVGIDHVDLQQEAVELGLRQRIGTLLLQRVLGRQHVERARQIVADAGNGDVILLHRLEQSGLGARAGAVDLVGHEKLGEDRAGNEAEAAGAVGRLVHHLRTGNVRWHQVRGELDAALGEPKDDAQRFDQLGLGETGNADQAARGRRRGW